MKKIKKTTDIITEIGKREEKRKHRHYMQLDDKYIRIGHEWKKQPFTGRPKINNKFIDKFKVCKDKEIINENTNWGAILAKARQYIKDNVYEYYNTSNRIEIWGHTEKADEWIKIVEFDAIKNYFFI